MTLITLTDHNSIDGALEMLDAGFPDVFISSEMTTTFPGGWLQHSHHDRQRHS